MEQIIILGIVPLVIVVLIYLINRTKHKEKMALIEKGIDLSVLRKPQSPFNNSLLWGLASLGGGLGLLIGFFLLQNHICTDDAIMGILALIFGGIALIIFYFINKTREKQ
jgi:hypothetical protein